MLKANLRDTAALPVYALLALAPLSAAAAQPAPPVPAPPAAAADPSQVGEIIVTAQRRQESLSRVGATVSVVGAAELASQGVESPADLTRLVPGFQATQSYNGNPVYTLRGVGFNSPNANSTPPVGLYLDEAAIPYPYMSTGLIFDLERVEVLKGPQGTLYGRNATGGLINFVTAKPTDELHVGGTVEIGNYKTVNANGFLSGPLGGGFKARVAFSTLNRNEGWQQSVTRDERLGKLHQNAVRGTLVYDDNGPFTATLTGNYWDRTGDTLAPQATEYFPGAAGNPLGLASVIAHPTSDTQADWVSVSHQPQADQGIYRPAPLTDSRFASGSLKAAYQFSKNVQLASLTTYQDLRHRDATDLGGFQIETNFQDNTGRIKSFSQELRLLGTGERFNWSVGGYYAKDTSSEQETGYNDENNQIEILRAVSESLPQDRYTEQQISRSFGNYQSRSSGNNEVLSAFANADYKFTDQLKLTLGGRFTQDKAKQDTCTYDYMGGNVPVINLFYGLIFNKTFNLMPGQCYTLQGDTTDFVNGAVHSSQKQHNFAWRANLDYTPSATTLIYGTISRGFKAGGFPLIAASKSTQFAPILQEQLTSYEVGSKLGLFDRAVQLNASAFYYDYKNKQIFGRVADMIFSTLARIDNIPKSHEYGVEGDITWRLTPQLRVNLAGVYVESKITDYTGFDQFSVVTNFAGKPYPYTPKFQGNMLVSYDAPVSETLRAAGTVAVSYQAKSNASAAELPEFAVKAYALVGATAGVAAANDRWSATLYVENLFNTYYWTGVESATDGIIRFPGMPRTGGVRVSFKY